MFDLIGDTVKAFTHIRLGPYQNLGNTLLVGEGNLSFAKSLLSFPATRITSITATTFETERQLSNETKINALWLKQTGANVCHGIDATKLHQSLKPQNFDTIIFQFPNVGSRDPKYGHNPNHVMIRKFFQSAKGYLAPNGSVLVSAVDSPHYEGVFQFDEAAEYAGFEKPQAYPFDPQMFSGYAHTNTNDDKSALDVHDKFVTWQLKVKA